MSKIYRFGISLEKKLIDDFDELIKRKKYQNRSEAIRDLIRKELVRHEWQSNTSEVAAAITLVYDHHQHGLSQKITHLQHDYYQEIITTQHIHLDHDNCLEVIVTRGKPPRIKEIADSLESLKGVKHCSVSMATTGKKIT